MAAQCDGSRGACRNEPSPASFASKGADMNQEADARARMVERQLVRRGISDARVLAAMRDTPRELFVPGHLSPYAYDDRPLPIESGQTISQPYIVALMLEAAALHPGDRALEIGAGSGYAAAVLSRLCAQVVTIERHAVLAERARESLRRAGCGNVRVLHGDGTRGVPDHAPYDAILVMAAGVAVPRALRDQLAPGGRLVIPVGDRFEQRLLKIVRRPGGFFSETDLGGVAFVPLIGEEDEDRP